MRVIFETHSTSIDNEAGLASGHYDAPLSVKGERQAVELGERYRETELDAIFSSDLRRAFQTAQLAFPGREIQRDSRLRECNYGEYTRRVVELIESERLDAILEPFPGGESYSDVRARVQGFLNDATARYRGGTILVIGHRATWFSLESLAKGVPLYDVISAPWQWSPGWTYSFPD